MTMPCEMRKSRIIMCQCEDNVYVPEEVITEQDLTPEKADYAKPDKTDSSPELKQLMQLLKGNADKQGSVTLDRQTDCGISYQHVQTNCGAVTNSEAGSMDSPSNNNMPSKPPIVDENDTEHLQAMTETNSLENLPSGNLTLSSVGKSTGRPRKNLEGKSPIKRPAVCKECGKEFTRASNMVQHVEVVHLKLKRHKCPKCGVCIGDRTAFNRHVRKHHEQPLRCQLCNNQYKSYMGWKCHIRKCFGPETTTQEAEAFLIGQMPENIGDVMNCTDSSPKKSRKPYGQKKAKMKREQLFLSPEEQSKISYNLSQQQVHTASNVNGMSNQSNEMFFSDGSPTTLGVPTHAYSSNVDHNLPPLSVPNIQSISRSDSPSHSSDGSKIGLRSPDTASGQISLKSRSSVESPTVLSVDKAMHNHMHNTGILAKSPCNNVQHSGMDSQHCFPSPNLSGPSPPAGSLLPACRISDRPFCLSSAEPASGVINYENTSDRPVTMTSAISNTTVVTPIKDNIGSQSTPGHPAMAFTTSHGNSFSRGSSKPFFTQGDPYAGSGDPMADIRNFLANSRPSIAENGKTFVGPRPPPPPYFSPTPRRVNTQFPVSKETCPIVTMTGLPNNSNASAPSTLVNGGQSTPTKSLGSSSISPVVTSPRANHLSISASPATPSMPHLTEDVSKSRLANILMKSASLPCVMCDAILDSPHSLMCHEQEHAEAGTIMCKLCCAFFDQLVQLREHIKFCCFANTAPSSR